MAQGFTVRGLTMRGFIVRGFTVKWFSLSGLLSVLLLLSSSAFADAPDVSRFAQLGTDLPTPNAIAPLRAPPGTTIGNSVPTIKSRPRSMKPSATSLHGKPSPIPTTHPTPCRTCGCSSTKIDFVEIR